MKELIRTLLLLSITFSTAFAQTKTDSLVTAYKKAANNQQRIAILKRLGETKDDASFNEYSKVITYNKLGIELARKMDKPSDEVYFLMALANSYNKNYNHAKALEISFDGLKLSRKLKDTANTCKFLNRIFTTMILKASNKEDIAKALNYGFAGLHLAQQANQLQIAGQLCYNISNAFSRPERLLPDSSMYFMRQAYQYAIAAKDPDIGYSISGLANREADLNHFVPALSYYHLAISFFKKDKNQRLVAWTYANISELHQNAGHLDSAFYYGKLSFDLSKQLNDPRLLDLSASQLAGFYKNKDELQSLRYYQIASIARDSLNTAEKIKEFQIVAAKEQQREEEAAEKLKKAQEERWQTLQLIAIGVFIPFFLVMVWLLKQTRIHRRLIDFMGVLSLLMVFEFINLLIHPHVVRITHHTPALELMILVALAAILVPMHHKLTHWLKEKISAAH